MISVQNKLKVHQLSDGKFLYDIETEIGSIMTAGGKMQSPEFFFRYSTFLSPGIIYHYDLSNNTKEVCLF